MPMVLPTPSIGSLDSVTLLALSVIMLVRQIHSFPPLYFCLQVKFDRNGEEIHRDPSVPLHACMLVCQIHSSFPLLNSTNSSSQVDFDRNDK